MPPPSQSDSCGLNGYNRQSEPPQDPSAHAGPRAEQMILEASGSADTEAEQPQPQQPAVEGQRPIRRRSLRGARNVSEPVVPAGPLSDAVKAEELKLEDVPDSQALAAWLQSQGVETKDWGSGNTKAVSKLHAELEQSEAGIELWKKEDGTVSPVRVTHVLRAKVCSPTSYDKDVFLFNTWQQYADGRTRIRNGLLSEKLTVAEMPLAENLWEVCQRAVTEEEMQRTAEAALRIGPDCPAPEFDPGYVCPLDVTACYFVEHNIEVETSKSYPGLLTMYHLYTVDIVVSGLPSTNFNTLEFDHPDKDGRRKLKYVHAWVWLHWGQIQRYLYEGSKMKERKQKGSFCDVKSLDRWLCQFDLDFDRWGVGVAKSVEDLYNELESSKAQLEVWRREDGVSLLIRVVHVLNLKVISSDPRLAGKVLFVRWQGVKNGSIRTVNRLISNQVSACALPFDEARFKVEVEKAVKARLSYIVDNHFRLHESNLPRIEDFTPAELGTRSIKFVDHRCDFEDSRSFPSISTVYHLYTVEVEVSGLPVADFTTLDFQGPRCLGLHWGTWQETLDSLHARMQAMERIGATQDVQIEAANASVQQLKTLTSLPNRTAAQELQMRKLVDNLSQSMARLMEGSNKFGDEGKDYSLASILPPDMVSKSTEEKLVTDGFLDEHQSSSNLPSNLQLQLGSNMERKRST
eukprot:TRINITY_DN38722_c0_g1_i1.p1 TRINITY_DN38722_c0_g1~~TRINITY_DN38722_c0_g1_i1.p1  ORF type:complete len:688 (+),score=131.23 TRINITY_DN38722_c0_g1_i1:34-2097(+)